MRATLPLVTPFVQLYVYENHPPKKPTYTLDQLRAIEEGRSEAGQGAEKGEEEEEQGDVQDSPADKAKRVLAAKKRMLLHAQRDYHPDRNQGMLRETLNYSPQNARSRCAATSVLVASGPSQDRLRRV